VRDVVTRRLRSAVGVAAAAVDVVTETCWMDNSGTTLPIASWSPADLPGPVVELDELDRRIVDQLITDGHESNREIARRLKVSDGTVRGRVKRLEDAGLIRLTAVVDTITTGDIASGASIFITTDGDDTALLPRLRELPNLGIVERCVGTCDVYAFAVAPSADELDRFVGRDLRGLPGVRSVEVATAVETLHHRAHLQHFGDSGETLQPMRSAADQISA
jgi:DNA-binding Lrp family transcriptional regulator